MTPCLRPGPLAPGDAFVPCSNCSLHFLQARTRRPSSRVAWATRVGLPHLGQTTITLEAWMVPARSMIPPSGFTWLRPFLRWRFTVMSFSIRTRFFSWSTSSTLPDLPFSRPERTFTVSFLWTSMAYSTSGARLMIFMNLRARSSRATGPKMRVPTGSRSLLMSTAEFPSKRM